MVAFIGTGNLNVTIAVMILGIPPILTNAFVGVRQVDRGAVDAARGIGMTELEIIRRVELPLAIPTIMGGVRTASVNIIATSTIGSLAGVKTLGDLILEPERLRRRGRDRRRDRRRAARAHLRADPRRPCSGLLTPRGLDASARRRPGKCIGSSLSRGGAAAVPTGRNQTRCVARPDCGESSLC